MAERVGFEEPALRVAPRTKSQARRLVLGLRRPEDGGEGGIIPDHEFLLIAVGCCWFVLRFIALTRYARGSLILQCDETR
jgi:hypothetical protein